MNFWISSKDQNILFDIITIQENEAADAVEESLQKGERYDELVLKVKWLLDVRAVRVMWHAGRSQDELR